MSVDRASNLPVVLCAGPPGLPCGLTPASYHSFRSRTPGPLLQFQFPSLAPYLFRREMRSVPEPASPTILCEECKHAFPPHQKIRWPFTLENIRSNYVPNSKEAALISDWIEETECEVERYTRKIDDLRTTYEKLEAERAYLQRYIDEYRTLLTPIRKLPPEILTEIFAMYCQDVPSMLRKPVLAPPMIIAQTCSFWRQLAFETPSLWASFHISLRPFPGSIQFLSAYLSRSKGMPLTIGLDSMEPNDDIILETLLEHSSRWKHLILHGADRLRSIEPPPRLPLLKSVELSTTGSLRASSMFKDAPALSTLILDNVEFEVPELETLPCSQLTSVTVRRLQINDALRVLHACTKLEDAVISSRRNFSPWVPILEYDPPFSLSSLTSLTFTTELFSHLFKSITVPALTSLTVATPTEPYNLEPWPQNEFVTFLERSACPLRRLSLVNIELTDTNLLAIFQHTPLLTHLSVKESPKHDIPPAITNKFLRRLTLPKPSPSQSLKAPPLPQLEFIDFVTHPSRIDYGLVVDLLSSRSSPLAHSCGVSVIKDVSVRQGFIDIPESVVPQHIIPKIGVPLAPLIDRITNRIFALGGSVVTPVFSSIRLVIPGIS